MLSNEQDAMNRALQIIVVFMAVAVSAKAQDEKPKATEHTADTSSINLAPRPVTTVQLQTPAPGTSNRPVPLAIATETSFRTPAVSPESTSSYISSLIGAGLPRYNPSPKAIDMAAAGAKSNGKANPTAPGIALLPAYIVRDAKIPDEEHILTYKGQAKIAMDKYLGPSDGLDRGLLNRYTLVQLWRKIPIIGGLPFVGTPGQMSNEYRAFDAGGANDTIPYPHPPPKVKDGSDEVN